MHVMDKKMNIYSFINIITGTVPYINTINFVLLGHISIKRNLKEKVCFVSYGLFFVNIFYTLLKTRASAMFPLKTATICPRD